MKESQTFCRRRVKNETCSDESSQEEEKENKDQRPPENKPYNPREKQENHGYL